MTIARDGIAMIIGVALTTRPGPAGSVLPVRGLTGFVGHDG